MRKKRWIVLIIVALAVLSACGQEDKTNNNATESEEIKTLDVKFEVPEKADVGKKVELKAIVTYGGEKVKEADKVEFEYWEKGNEDESTKVEAINNEDGTYTAEVAFDRDGIVELYAHVTAKALHTMPQKSITVGGGADTDNKEGHDDDQTDEHEHGGHAEGFGMHFMKPEDVKVDEKMDMTVHLQMGNEPLENANVRYEIVKSNTENHEWVETEESKQPGEYTATDYGFKEAGTYTITIHVENDEGLHEHEDHQIEVTN